MLFIDIFVEVSFFLVLILTLFLVWNIQNLFVNIISALSEQILPDKYIYKAL